MGERASSDKERVCLGVIVGAYGIKGAVRVKSFTGVSEEIACYGSLSDEDGRLFRVTVIGGSGTTVLCSVAGVEDRTAAERLKGCRLYVDRDVLPALEEDTFYHSDLIGLPVFLGDGTRVGKVATLHDFGAGDILEIVGDAGGSVLIPFTRETVPDVDVAGGRVIVERVPGLLEGPVVPKLVKKVARARVSAKGLAERAGGPEEDWPEEDWR